MNPFFSIIIPLYNREKTISRAIDSVLNQTFQNFEIIIVDDCSTDNSALIVGQIQDIRIKYFKNNSNQERCVTRNRGILESVGKYICFLDSDDYHLPFHLETFYTKIEVEHFPKGFFFSSAWNETEDGIRTERICPFLQGMDLYHYFLNYTVNPQRWCVEQSVAKAILFDSEITICEDLDFSLRLVTLNFPVFQIPVRTTVYVAASDSFTISDSLKWEKELFYLNRIFAKPSLKKHLKKKDINRLKSICYYHLASKSIKLNKKLLTLIYALKSIFLLPRGYKKGIIKDLFILILVSFRPFKFKSISFKKLN